MTIVIDSPIAAAFVIAIYIIGCMTFIVGLLYLIVNLSPRKHTGRKSRYE